MYYDFKVRKKDIVEVFKGIDDFIDYYYDKKTGAIIGIDKHEDIYDESCCDICEKMGCCSDCNDIENRYILISENETYNDGNIITSAEQWCKKYNINMI